MACLDWLRESPAFSEVLLKDFTEDGFRVQVFGVFSAAFAAKYEKTATKTVNPAGDALDEQRRLALRDVLQAELKDGPEMLDVELRHVDYDKEDPADFVSPGDVFRVPSAAYLFFKLDRKAEAKKGATTATADDPEADAGGPRYVVRDVVAPAGVEDPDARADFEPDWLTWKPNPSYEKVGPLLEDVKALIRPARPVWKKLAAELNEKHSTLTGKAFTEANVWRVVVAAELLLGNELPGVEN
jgi:hypothetical protein